MPGRSVKSWKQYHGLRKRGFSKQRAAKITNAPNRGGKHRKTTRK